MRLSQKMLGPTVAEGGLGMGICYRDRRKHWKLETSENFASRPHSFQLSSVFRKALLTLKRMENVNHCIDYASSQWN